MPLLELTEVDARYGQVRALHGVSLTVDEGEVVALLGANGAGKTTTLRAISGSSRATATLVFDGKPLPRKPEETARRGITHVPEGRGILGGADASGRTSGWAPTCAATARRSRATSTR